jgi:hypothetical protein
MEFFFYETWFPADYSGNDAIQEAAMDWIGKHNDRSLLVLNQATLIVQGFMQNETREGAAEQAAYVASDLYWAIDGGNRDDLKITVRDVAEQLEFVNSGIVPEHQVSHLHSNIVMELGAASIIRSSGTTEAQLYKGRPPA